GWGHSTFEGGAAVAEAAGVSELCLFHHDPSHDDGFMDALAARARRRFANTRVAAEGLVLALDGHLDGAAAPEASSSSTAA
ncbi:hypothetical protein PPSIR1_06833, partial [Plesiocystis pacifica SIR-1]